VPPSSGTQASAPEQASVPLPGPVIPGPVLLLGAPGAGKGTQAQVLMARWQVPQISTGDLFRTVLRDPVKSATPTGAQVKALYDRGQLIPDDLVNQMVADRLAEPDTARGYILDGFPRTLGQAKWLDTHLHRGGESALPVVAVSIQVSYTQLLCRITGRRTCPVCRSIYNVYSNPPKIEGKCDVEGALLEQRADDSEAVFHERMKTFGALTSPVIDHYRALGRFEEVNGEQHVDEVTAAIVAALMRLRKN